MTKLSLKTPFLEAEWSPQEKDREAAWELYVEMLTRITTQPLPDDVGDEKVALDSVYAIFPLMAEEGKRLEDGFTAGQREGAKLGAIWDAEYGFYNSSRGSNRRALIQLQHASRRSRPRLLLHNHTIKRRSCHKPSIKHFDATEWIAGIGAARPSSSAITALNNSSR